VTTEDSFLSAHLQLDSGLTRACQHTFPSPPATACLFWHFPRLILLHTTDIETEQLEYTENKPTEHSTESEPSVTSQPATQLEINIYCTFLTRFTRSDPYISIANRFRTIPRVLKHSQPSPTVIKPPNAFSNIWTHFRAFLLVSNTFRFFQFVLNLPHVLERVLTVTDFSEPYHTF
jgi:hypothetical protein